MSCTHLVTDRTVLYFRGILEFMALLGVKLVVHTGYHLYFVIIQGPPIIACCLNQQFIVPLRWGYFPHAIHSRE
jgi:hypothetical protein